MMENNQFELVLQTISTGLVAMIITETGLDEDTAMEKLYRIVHDSYEIFIAGEDSMCRRKA